MNPSKPMNMFVRKEIVKQESKLANQLLVSPKYFKPEQINVSQPTTSSQKFLLPVKTVPVKKVPVRTVSVRTVPVRTVPVRTMPVKIVQYRVANVPKIQSTLKVKPIVIRPNPRQPFLFPVKISQPAVPRPVVKPIVPQAPKLGNFRMRMMPTAPENKKRKLESGNEASGSVEDGVPAKKKKNVEEVLNELDKEYEEECGKKVKLEWLSGNYPVRKECLSLFEENAHPSPKEILDIATRFSTSYRMVYDNFHRIRVHHEIPCKSGDNCRRIHDYFHSVAPTRGYFRLTAEQRNVLEVEMFKMFRQSITLNVGQMHVLADITGLPTYVVRSQSFALRRRFLVSSDPDGSVKNKAELMKEFNVDPFPNPKMYQIIASRLEIRYDDVQRFYTSARLKHVEKHGQYNEVHEELNDRTAEALWKVARNGKQLGLEKRKELAKSLAVPYFTIAYWLDNYMSQLRWGCNTYMVDVSDDEFQEESEEHKEDEEVKSEVKTESVEE